MDFIKTLKGTLKGMRAIVLALQLEGFNSTYIPLWPHSGCIAFNSGGKQYIPQSQQTQCLSLLQPSNLKVRTLETLPICLGPRVVPVYPFFGEGSPTVTLQKKGTLILTSLLEDLVTYLLCGPK